MSVLPAGGEGQYLQVLSNCICLSGTATPLEFVIHLKGRDEQRSWIRYIIPVTKKDLWRCTIREEQNEKVARSRSLSEGGRQVGLGFLGCPAIHGMLT